MSRRLGLAGLIALVFAVCVPGPAVAQEDGAQAMREALTPYLGSWICEMAPGVKVRNDYSWAFGEAVMKVKTFMIRGESEPQLMLESVFVWDKARGRCVSIGYGQGLYEQNVMEFEGRQVKVGWTAFVPGEGSPVRVTLTLAEDGKSFSQVMEKRAGEVWAKQRALSWKKSAEG